jgi:calcineurin-like phosphoesterase family protein
MIKIEKDIKGKLPEVWIFSDPHYNHKNICRGTTNWRTIEGEIPVSQTRDFSTLDKMNESIVNGINWNVKQDDILICLGDWSFGGFEYIEEFRNRIVCKNIHLVLGNHDHHIERNRGDIQNIFTSVSDYETLIIGKRTFRLFHYPIQSWDGMNKGVIHLHGHVHLPNDKKFGSGKKMDVGIDGHPEFRPYHILKEIVPIMEKRQSISDMTDDHHTKILLNVDR